MDDLQGALHEVHAVARSSGAATENAGGSAAATSGTSIAAAGSVAALRPFAVVLAVEEHSPARDAGLQPGDRIYSFRSVAGAAASVQQIAQLLPVRVLACSPCLCCTASSYLAFVLQACEGQEVVVALFRQGEARSCVLTPRKWAGRGLLGCAMDALVS